MRDREATRTIINEQAVTLESAADQALEYHKLECLVLPCVRLMIKVGAGSSELV